MAGRQGFMTGGSVVEGPRSATGGPQRRQGSGKSSRTGGSCTQRMSNAAAYHIMPPDIIDYPSPGVIDYQLTDVYSFSFGSTGM